MSHRPRPFLLIILLLAIGVRTTLGAPCCMTPLQAAEIEASENAHHAVHGEGSEDDHSGHGDDPTAKPCCSACGPTLPPEPGIFIARETVRELPSPTPIRALATRPPFPAYDATGPPALI